MENKKIIKSLSDQEATKRCNEQLHKENPKEFSKESLELLEERFASDHRKWFLK